MYQDKNLTSNTKLTHFKNHKYKINTLEYWISQLNIRIDYNCLLIRQKKERKKHKKTNKNKIFKV